jgi:hypothetical protein
MLVLCYSWRVRCEQSDAIEPKTLCPKRWRGLVATARRRHGRRRPTPKVARKLFHRIKVISSSSKSGRDARRRDIWRRGRHGYTVPVPYSTTQRIRTYQLSEENHVSHCQHRLSCPRHHSLSRRFSPAGSSAARSSSLQSRLKIKKAHHHGLLPWTSHEKRTQIPFFS